MVHIRVIFPGQLVVKCHLALLDPSTKQYNRKIEENKRMIKLQKEGRKIIFYIIYAYLPRKSEKSTKNYYSNQRIQVNADLKEIFRNQYLSYVPALIIETI